MILGGGPNQIGLLKAAKEAGYYIVLCDKNSKCIGKKFADSFYNADIIDEEAIKKIAKEENIKGIVSNSEAVMEVVAEVASELGLIGNSRESISILNSKEAFRDYQNSIGIFTPKHCVLNDIYSLNRIKEDYTFPIIIKPVKCSGTRGTTRIDYYDETKIKSAIKQCISYSRDKRCEIEEYVEMPSLTVLEGDVFVNDGVFFWGGLYYTVRSNKLPMVPMTYMSPYTDSANHIETIKEVLSRVFMCLPIRHGQYNVEAYFNKNDRLFIIEINARQGGHGLPAYVKLATGIDLDRMLVTTAMGDNDYFDSVIKDDIKQKFATRHTIFSDKSGILKGIHINDNIKQYVVEIEYDKRVGETVEKRINGSSYIGFVNLIFDSFEKQHEISESIEDYIYPIVE